MPQLSVLLLAFLPSILADLVCYRQWYLDRPQPAPRRCPPGDWLFYYECCGPLDDCCQRWRVELIVVLCVVAGILILCCCCCILGIVFRRRRKVGENEPDWMSKDERQCHEAPVPPVGRSTQV